LNRGCMAAKPTTTATRTASGTAVNSTRSTGDTGGRSSTCRSSSGRRRQRRPGMTTATSRASSAHPRHRARIACTATRRTARIRSGGPPVVVRDAAHGSENRQRVQPRRGCSRAARRWGSHHHSPRAPPCPGPAGGGGSVLNDGGRYPPLRRMVPGRGRCAYHHQCCTCLPSGGSRPRCARTG